MNGIVLMDVAELMLRRVALKQYGCRRQAFDGLMQLYGFCISVNLYLLHIESKDERNVMVKADDSELTKQKKTLIETPLEKNTIILNTVENI